MRRAAWPGSRSARRSRASADCSACRRGSCSPRRSARGGGARSSTRRCPRCRSPARSRSSAASPPAAARRPAARRWASRRSGRRCASRRARMRRRSRWPVSGSCASRRSRSGRRRGARRGSPSCGSPRPRYVARLRAEERHAHALEARSRDRRPEVSGLARASAPRRARSRDHAARRADELRLLERDAAVLGALARGTAQPRASRWSCASSRSVTRSSPSTTWGCSSGPCSCSGRPTCRCRACCWLETERPLDLRRAVLRDGEGRAGACRRTSRRTRWAAGCTRSRRRSGARSSSAASRRWRASTGSTSTPTGFGFLRRPELVANGLEQELAYYERYLTWASAGREQPIAEARAQLAPEAQADRRARRAWSGATRASATSSSTAPSSPPCSTGRW